MLLGGASFPTSRSESNSGTDTPSVDAALLPSPQLTFRALRSLIPTLADVGESYRFATLAEEIVEEGHDGEKVVDEGVFVIVGAGASSSPFSKEKVQN